MTFRPQDGDEQGDLRDVRRPHHSAPSPKRQSTLASAIDPRLTGEPSEKGRVVRSVWDLSMRPLAQYDALG